MKEHLPGKIYIVIGDFSSWDSHHTRFLRAFYSSEDANKYVEKANRILKSFSKHIQDAFDKTNLDFEDGTPYEEMGKLLEEYEKTEEYIRALNIWGAHSEFQEFNRCYIKDVKIQ